MERPERLDHSADARHVVVNELRDPNIGFGVFFCASSPRVSIRRAGASSATAPAPRRQHRAVAVCIRVARSMVLLEIQQARACPTRSAPRHAHSASRHAHSLAVIASSRRRHVCPHCLFQLHDCHCNRRRVLSAHTTRSPSSPAPVTHLL